MPDLTRFSIQEILNAVYDSSTGTLKTTTSVALSSGISSDTTTAQANATTITNALNAAPQGAVVVVNTPGTYYFSRPTANYDAAIQCDNLTGVSLQLGKGVTFKLADSANCYLDHWYNCTDCESIGGTWDGNVAGNNGNPLAWYLGWHGDVRWIDGCTGFRIDGATVQADPTYQGTNAVIHGIWVTGSSHGGKFPSKRITLSNIYLNMQRDGIHVCGGLEDYSFTRIRGFHGDNGLGMGTADYPAHQVSFGSHKRGYINDIQFEGGLQAPISFFGRNENEQVAGGTATQIKNENCTVSGMRGAVQSVVVASVVKGNPTIVNTATPYLLRNGVSISFSLMAGTNWTNMNNQSLAITQISTTQFSVPFDSSAYTSNQYTANSGRVSSCASGIQIADDTAGGGGNTYTGFTVTSLSLSGDSLTATITPNIFASGSGGTYAPILPGTLMVVDSVGTNEAVQVQYVNYTGLAAAPTSFVCIKTNGTVFSAAAGTYAGKTLTGSSPGSLTGLYVDSMLWDDIAPIVPVNQPIVSLTGTGIQTLKISKINLGSKNANFGGILATANPIGNLIVDTVTADQGFNGTGLTFGSACNVKRWSLSNMTLDGTGGSTQAIGVTMAGTLAHGVIHNCHMILGNILVNTPTSSGLAAPTFFEMSNCSYNGSAGSGSLITWGAGAGAASECLLNNCYALSGAGSSIGLTGANALILTVRSVGCHFSSTGVARSVTQQIRAIGDTSLKFDAAFFTASPTAGDSFYNSNSASFAGIGQYDYTTGWVARLPLTITVADAGTIGNYGNQIVTWSTGTAAQTELLPAAPFTGQTITFVNATTAVPTTLSGNGKNIVLAGAASAANFVAVAATSYRLVYDGTIWRQV